MPKKKTYKGSFRSVIDMARFIGKDAKLPKQIQVLPHGKYMTMPYGPMVLNEEIFTSMVNNFKAGIRKAVPVDVDHDGGKAAGWIEKLVNKGADGLWAAVDWTRYGKDLLTSREYRLFSPEWTFDYKDPQHSTHHGAVLVAGSLTNRPLFKDLDFVKASDGTRLTAKDLTKDNAIVIIMGSDEKKHPTMKIKDILKKDAADRSADEVKFLKDAELSDKQTEQLADEVKAQKVAEKKEAKKEAEKEAKEAAAKAKKAKENDKDVTMKASEIAELKQAKTELDSMKAKEEVEKLVKPLIASDKGGRILPKSQKKVVKFLLTCNEDQKAAFVEVMESMPELKIAGEEGDSKGGNLTAKDEIEKLVKDAMKADKKLAKSEAYGQVLKADENKKLVEKYGEELKSE